MRIPGVMDMAHGSAIGKVERDHVRDGGDDPRDGIDDVDHFDGVVSGNLEHGSQPDQTEQAGTHQRDQHGDYASGSQQRRDSDALADWTGIGKSRYCSRYDLCSDSLCGNASFQSGCQPSEGGVRREQRDFLKDNLVCSQMQIKQNIPRLLHEANRRGIKKGRISISFFFGTNYSIAPKRKSIHCLRKNKK